MSREACLRPEFAELYPALRSGRWEPAVIIVEKLVAELFLYHRAGMHSIQAVRRLKSEHFDFRDGPRHDAPAESGYARADHRHPRAPALAVRSLATSTSASQEALPSSLATHHERRGTIDIICAVAHGATEP